MTEKKKEVWVPETRLQVDVAGGWLQVDVACGCNATEAYSQRCKLMLLPVVGFQKCQELLY